MVLSKIKQILGKENVEIVNSIGNRPRNLTNNLLPVIKSNYAVGVKADGLRCLLYYDKKEISRILNPFEVKKLDIELKKPQKICLFDCEYIEEIDEYYVFDVLIHNGENVTNLNLRQRISLITNDFLNEKVKLKKVYNLENDQDIFKISGEIYNTKYSYKLDGLVYTPIFEPYYNPFIYKWKPLHQQTIDFLIRETSENKYSLFVSSDNRNIKKKLLTDENYKKLFPFITEKNRYYPSEFTEPVTINSKKITLNKEVFGNHNNIVIKDNTIVEFYYDNGWKPYKLRLDKTEGYLQNFSKGVYEVTKGPNSWRTATNIFNYIKNPIDKKVLFGEKPLADSYYMDVKKKGLKINLYSYNNFIKSFLYKKYLKKGDFVLDLAGGRGGDLHKLKNSKYVLHLNVVNNLLEEAKNRYGKMENKPDINFLKFDLLGNNVNKIEKIKKNKNVDKFDVITCQFAFHYFCKSKANIDFMINLINENLKESGIFMMTGYDGNIIHDLLKDKDNLDFRYDNKLFARIVKKYKGTFKNYGQEINVYVEKIGLPQDEYLINFEYLNKQFKKHNIKVIEEDNFGTKLVDFGKQLSDSEIEYVKLHKYVVYQKEK